MKKRTKLLLSGLACVAVVGAVAGLVVSCSGNGGYTSLNIPSLFNTGVNANLKNIYNQQVSINKNENNATLTTSQANTDLSTFVKYLETNSPESQANNYWAFALISYGGSYMAYNYNNDGQYFSSVFTWFPIWNLAYFLQCTQVNGSIAKHSFLDSFVNLVNNNLIPAQNQSILTALNNGLEQYLQSALNNNLISGLNASLLKVTNDSFNDKTDYLSLTLQYDNSNTINTGVYLTDATYTKTYSKTFKPFYHQIKRYGDYVYNYKYNDGGSAVPIYYPYPLVIPS